MQNSMQKSGDDAPPPSDLELHSLTGGSLSDRTAAGPPKRCYRQVSAEHLTRCKELQQKLDEAVRRLCFVPLQRFVKIRALVDKIILLTCFLFKQLEKDRGGKDVNDCVWQAK